MNKTVDYKNFEEPYISLRRKEGRLYTDEELKRLPQVSATHPLKKEWQIRKESCQRLVNFLSKKRKPLQILEVGCGNGWLCNRLSAIATTIVTGLDINELELSQAKRVFPSITFLHGDLRDGITNEKYDAIIFAASLQYFPSVNEILTCCIVHLNSGGEIHIIDTNFYSKEEMKNAESRSDDYFSSAGFPQMATYYFHHSASALEGFHYKFMFQPRNLLNRFFRRTPFPWICIKK
jgi:ubiquinone/menaquinone biosynthesis C-methylase UbiE